MKEFDAVVIGSGAAGFNAANRIKEMSNLSVAIVTEDINCGTSRNTGSDKQTYYKLSLSGDSADSVRQMAEDLFACGSTDGDTALCEAALSVRSFMNLCELGVKFPTNRYGEYIGYKTDHDPRARATSAGPLTSKFMTEALEKRAKELNVEILSGYLAVEILKDENGVAGLLCIKTDSGELAGIKCANIIIATGGPGGIYYDSVYPKCHTGSTGLAVKAGAKMQNLTEWQFGLASVNPRWNVSGTYMQVLPRFVSVDESGNEYEFLLDFFSDPYEALSQVFLKGYQWPFDSRKILDGSSVIDLLVYKERVIKNRRVYLDFTKNPFNLNGIDFSRLSPEAYEYLKNAQALFGTPIERLKKMNMPAVELYASKGCNIEKEYLEIALCAQHCNGGIAVDMWWQTNIPGLFAAGECAGTHGIARPGGSALNSGQVGSLRAAQYICAHPRKQGDFDSAFVLAYRRHSKMLQNILSESDNIDALIAGAQKEMSASAGAIRIPSLLDAAAESVKDALADIEKAVRINSLAGLYKFYKLYDILLTQRAVIACYSDFSKTKNVTRGSALYNAKDGSLRAGLDEIFRFRQENGETKDFIQETVLENGRFICSWRKVRPIPENDGFFENVWRSYRENGNIY